MGRSPLPVPRAAVTRYPLPVSRYPVAITSVASLLIAHCSLLASRADGIRENAFVGSGPTDD